MAFLYLAAYLERGSLDQLSHAELQALLRTILSQPPAYEPWQAALELLGAWPVGPQRQAAFSEAQQALATWPDDTRTLSSHWAPLFDEGGAAPVLALARVVTFHRHEQGATTALRKLAGSPHARNLHVLELDRCEILSAGWQALASSPNLQGLQRLKVHNCSLSHDERELLLASPLLRQLTSLQLTKLDLTDADAARLARAAGPATLRELDISRNQLGAGGVQQLLSSGTFGAGARLSVRKNRISDTDHAALEREASIAQIALEL